MYPAPILSNLTADNFGKIPRIVHQTGEVKCLTEPFYNNAKAWSFEGAGYSFYFHDRLARQVLLEKHWPEFPHLQITFECLKNAGGAGVSDLWRYLALWEYGGIYTDMDNKPGPKLNSTTIHSLITPDMDAYFFQSKVGSPGYPSQFFFAVSPKHPIMYLAVMKLLQNMLDVDDVGNFYVPRTTGPNCLARAFMEFVGIKKSEIARLHLAVKMHHHAMSHPNKGTYYGMMNRSVTIGANQDKQQAIVRASALAGQIKRDGWKRMNFTDYQHMNKVKQHKTCTQLILEQHLERMEMPFQQQLR